MEFVVHGDFHRFAVRPDGHTADIDHLSIPLVSLFNGVGVNFLEGKALFVLCAKGWGQLPALPFLIPNRRNATVRNLLFPPLPQLPPTPPPGVLSRAFRTSCGLGRFTLRAGLSDFTQNVPGGAFRDVLRPFLWQFVTLYRDLNCFLQQPFVHFVRNPFRPRHAH